MSHFVFELNLALSVGPVVTDGDTGSPCHNLKQGRQISSSRFSEYGPRLRLTPSRSRSIFVTSYRPVAVLTFSRCATATATKRIREAGTLGFTSPVIMKPCFSCSWDLFGNDMGMNNIQTLPLGQMPIHIKFSFLQKLCPFVGLLPWRACIVNFTATTVSTLIIARVSTSTSLWGGQILADAG